MSGKCGPNDHGLDTPAAAGVHPLTGELIGDGKVRLLLEWLEDHPDEPALVLSRFTAPIKATVAALERAGIKVGAITGETPKAERAGLKFLLQQKQKEFNFKKNQEVSYGERKRIFRK